MVIDRFVNYRLRADGICSSDLSIDSQSYYEVSLEVVNCNELDRRLPYMTCHGLLFPKSGKVGEGIDGETIIVVSLAMVYKFSCLRYRSPGRIRRLFREEKQLLSVLMW